MISLKELLTSPRRSAKSYCELLPWFGLISPGLVLCHDGSLLAAFKVEGNDVEGKDGFEIDQQIDQFQTSQRVFNDRCTLWSIRSRRFIDGYESGAFTNPVSALLDKEWGSKCRAVRNAEITQQIFVGYKLPNKSEAFFEALMSEIRDCDNNAIRGLSSLLSKRLTEKGAIAQVRGQLLDLVEAFEKILESFSGIVGVSLGIVRLRDDELLGELYGRANLASEPGPVSVPEGLPYLNTYLAADDIERQGALIRYRGPAKQKYVAALSSTGTPKRSHASHLDRLMRIDAEFVLVQCFRFLDPLEAEAAIQEHEMFYRSEYKSVATRVAERLFNVESEKVNTGNLYLAEDAQEALVELTAGDVSYGHFNMTVLAMGDTPQAAEDAADTIAGSLRASKFTVIREVQGLMPALLTSIPGNNEATLRWRLVSTGNIAEMAPLRTITKGEDHHPLISTVLGHRVPPLCRFITPSRIPFDYNPHEGDLGHTAVIGGSGAGKTALMTLLISMFQKYLPSQTFIIDKDYSLMVATVLMGGSHVDMGKGAKRRAMNPVRVMLANGDDLRLRQWIEVLITAGGNTVDSTEGATIFSAIQALRTSSLGEPSLQRLGAIYAHISGQDQRLAAKLAPYVDRSEEENDLGQGPYATYFDNIEDDFAFNTMIGMEVGGILETSALASPFMDYVFYCIDQKLDGTTPTMIYIEEAWYMLSNPVFLQKMEDWLRTFRKKKAFIVFATQSLHELSELPNLGAFISNIPSLIFLPPVKNSVQEVAHLYKAVFGTTEAQLELLRTAIPKKDYLLIRPKFTRLVNAQMSPALLAINEATTVPRLRASVLEYAERGGVDWQLNYLREKLNVKC